MRTLTLQLTDLEVARLHQLLMKTAGEDDLLDLFNTCAEHVEENDLDAGGYYDTITIFQKD